MKSPFSRVSALKAGLLMAASTYVTVALGLIVGALIARGLGPDDYGRYAYVLWLSGLLVTLGNHGLCITGMRFISEAIGGGRRSIASSLHHLLQRWQWLSMAVVAICFVLAFPMMLPSGWAQGYILLTLAIVISASAKAQFQFGVSMAKGYGEFGVEAWGNMIMSVVYTAGVALLVVLGVSLTWFVGYFVLVSVAHVWVLRVLLAKVGIKQVQGECSVELRSRINSHLMWSVVHIGTVILSNKTIETFLLNKLVGAAEVGYFTIASNLTRGGVELVASSLTSMLMPLMGHAFGRGGLKAVNAVLSDSLRYCLFMGIIVAGLGGLWAGPGVALLYGQSYEPVIQILRLMVVVGGVVLVEAAFGAVLTTTDNQRLRATAAMISVAFSVGFAFAMVPIYGLWGAVWATSLSKLLVTFFVAWVVVRKLEMQLPWRHLLGLLLAGLGAASIQIPLLYLDDGLLMQFICGGLFVPIAVVLSAWFGAWRAKDIRLLVSILERRDTNIARHFTRLLTNWLRRLERQEN